MRLARLATLPERQHLVLRVLRVPTIVQHQEALAAAARPHKVHVAIARLTGRCAARCAAAAGAGRWLNGWRE